MIEVMSIVLALPQSSDDYSTLSRFAGEGNYRDQVYGWPERFSAESFPSFCLTTM